MKEHECNGQLLEEKRYFDDSIKYSCSGCDYSITVQKQREKQ